MRHRIALLLLLLPVFAWGQRQTYYQYKTDDVSLVFFDKNLSRYIPHIVRMYDNGKALHSQVWATDSLYVPEAPLLMITDWEDEGNGGVSAIPHTMIQIGMAPLGKAYNVYPSAERYRHLFDHEYTHVVMTDKYNSTDLGWRRFFGLGHGSGGYGAKVTPDSQHPLSALWSYLSVPRWYSPRWYHEGIACYMETWLGGGVGRSLGGYDEMYFRSIIDGGHDLFSVVGLETEGTTMDFQVGANAYLYGTRFVNYLSRQYGFDKLISFYNRTDGSRAPFGSQFKSVYGRSLRDVWSDWQQDEREHQQANLEAVREHPLTPTTALTSGPLGSVSPMVYDSASGKAYAAVNSPGRFGSLVEIDLCTGRQRRLVTIDGVQLYNPAYVALDRNGGRVFLTTNNSKMRGLQVYDLKRGRTVERKKFQRIADIVYDNANDCLYGIMSNAGTHSIVRYDKNLESPEIVYSFPFGVSIFDIDVSHDGTLLSFTRSGNNGEQTLMLLDLKQLEKAIFKPVELITWNDANLGQFRFSLDDSHLIGSSYYTGVSNLWQLNIQTREMELLSNTDIGLFAPLEIAPDRLMALQFERDGMKPVTLARRVVTDANAITLYGQRAYNADRQALDAVGQLKEPPAVKEFGDVYNNIKPYHVLKEMRFEGAYPTITGFIDRNAWNKVTPVLGYRFYFCDPVGLSSVKLGVGMSPWSSNSWENRVHADLEWRYYFWTLKAAWNPTSFHDLAGPVRESRKGYKVTLAYDYTNSITAPYKKSWGFSLGAYGLMDALPMFQEIAAEDIRSLQTATVYGKISKLRKSLGAVMDEQGYQLGLRGYTYLAKGQFFPSVEATGDFGLLLPVGRNNSFWLRTAAGHNFGDSRSALGNTYFGGFRNNYVDYRDAFQYRTSLAMPGAPIDAIQAHSYAKATAELNLSPIRFNNFGALYCYPTWTQCSLFATGLSAWNPDSPQRSYVSTGIQLTTEVVFFNYLKTTLSLGYAHLFAPEGFPGGRHGNEFTVSLKLL
ncbi:MAG: hypothetical protein J5737_04875 [Bacteroidales bacterium]|nr:hypothetical protein [Bacteroidales bacterium]